MLFGSLLAIVIAYTKVVLPYDETFVGMTATHNFIPLITTNTSFSHTRIVFRLAGVMITVGVLFTGIAWFGTRQGKHWAQQTIFISASVGFARLSFSFLAMDTSTHSMLYAPAIMSQFMLLSLITDYDIKQPDAACLDNDRGLAIESLGTTSGSDTRRNANTCRSYFCRARKHVRFRRSRICKIHREPLPKSWQQQIRN